MGTFRCKLPVGAKRQVTIPKKCMDLLSLKEDGELLLEVDGDDAILLPVVSIPRRWADQSSACSSCGFYVSWETIGDILHCALTGDLRGLVVRVLAWEASRRGEFRIGCMLIQFL